MRDFTCIFLTSLSMFWASPANASQTPLQTPFSTPPAGTPEAKQDAVPLPQKGAATAPDLHIKWFGHACFSFHDKAGHSVLTDPYDRSVGYKPPSANTRIVTVSHAHPDHNAVEQFKGKPIVVNRKGETGAGGLVFRGIPSWHDSEQGQSRGANLIFVWEMSGLKIAHLGDFGQSEFTPEQRAALSHIDVLLIPVGGTYTIDAAQAMKLVQDLTPLVIIPMHYKTPAAKADLMPVDDFLGTAYPVERIKSASLKISKTSLPSRPTVYVMEYVK